MLCVSENTADQLMSSLCIIAESHGVAPRVVLALLLCRVEQSNPALAVLDMYNFTLCSCNKHVYYVCSIAIQLFPGRNTEDFS